MPRAPSISLPESFLRVFDGLMLGDGNLWGAKTRPTFNSCYRQSSVSADWLEDLANNWRNIDYRTSVYFDRTHICKDGRESKIWFLQTCSTPELTAQRKRWYPEGVKRCPKDFELTPEAVRQWYFGDGTLRRGAGTQAPFAALCAEGYAKDEIAWLLERLRQHVGAANARATAKGRGWNLEFTNEGTERLFDLIGPNPYPTLSRKFARHRRTE